MNLEQRGGPEQPMNPPDTSPEQKKPSLEERLLKAGVPPECFEDEELKDLVLKSFPNLNMRMSLGFDVALEESGMANDRVSKLLLSALDRAIYKQRPDLAAKIASIAKFPARELESHVWDEGMMRLVSRFGWEYFFDVCRAFDIDMDKARGSLRRSIMAESIRSTFGVMEAVFQAEVMKGFEQACGDDRFKDAAAVASHYQINREAVQESISKKYLKSLERFIDLRKAEVIRNLFPDEVNAVDARQAEASLVMGLSRFLRGLRKAEKLTSNITAFVKSIGGSALRNPSVRMAVREAYFRLCLNGEKLDVFTENFPADVSTIDSREIVDLLSKLSTARSSPQAAYQILRAAPEAAFANPEVQKAGVDAYIQMLMMGQKTDAMIETFHLDSGVIEAEIRKAVIEPMTQSIKAGDFAKVKTLNDRVRLLPNDVCGRNRFPILKKAVESGFSLMELSRYPFLISSVL